MRNRTILLLAAGLTGAFFAGLGMLTFDAPPERIHVPAPPPNRAAAELPSGPSGWEPWQTTPIQPKEDRPIATLASVEAGAAPEGEAGIWSTPAEFAEPE